MEKINFPRKFKVYLPLMALFLVLVFMMPRSPKFNYDYRKGSPWLYSTLVAQFDFPILKTEAQLVEEREKAGSVYIPYYRLDGKTASKSISAVSSLDLGSMSDVKVHLSDAITALYSKGILSPSAGRVVEELRADPDALIYVQKDRRAVKVLRACFPQFRPYGRN